jgi:hypothetical protein
LLFCGTRQRGTVQLCDSTYPARPRGTDDQEALTFGFDFWAIPGPSWLKSSSDLMLRISRLALFLTLFPVAPITPLSRGTANAGLGCPPVEMIRKLDTLKRLRISGILATAGRSRTTGAPRTPHSALVQARSPRWHGHHTSRPAFPKPNCQRAGGDTPSMRSGGLSRSCGCNVSGISLLLSRPYFSSFPLLVHAGCHIGAMAFFPV